MASLEQLSQLWDVEGVISDEAFEKMKDLDITEQVGGSVKRATEMLNSGQIEIKGISCVVKSESQKNTYMLTKGAFMQNLITTHLNLEPSTEGGFGAPMFISRLGLPPPQVIEGRPRGLASSSFYMLTASHPFCFFHSIKNDVGYVFVQGAPVRLSVWDEEKKTVEHRILGNDLTQGHVLYTMVEGGNQRFLMLQEGYTTFSLIHFICSPEFSPADREFATPELFTKPGFEDSKIEFESYLKPSE